MLLCLGSQLKILTHGTRDVGAYFWVKGAGSECQPLIRAWGWGSEAEPLKSSITTPLDCKKTLSEYQYAILARIYHFIAWYHAFAKMWGGEAAALSPHSGVPVLS